MSLILEALRKSEAERRRGEAPDLRVELPPHAPAKRGMPRAAWLAGGSVAAVLAAAIVWWQVSPTDVARDGERREVAAGMPDSTMSWKAASMMRVRVSAECWRRELLMDM